VVLDAPVAADLTTGTTGNPHRPDYFESDGDDEMNQRRRAWGRGLFLCLVTTVAVAADPAMASAHAVLASSQPQAGQRLGTAPGVVVLEFSEPVNAKLSRATVTDPSGRRFAGGGTEGQEIRVPLSTNASGVYTVDWVSVSTLDGHAVHGSFQFGVGVTPRASSAETAQTAPGEGDLAIAVLRWVEYLALLVAVGMLLLRGLARRSPELGWVGTRLVVPLGVALVSGLAVVSSEAISAAGSASLGGVWSYLSTGLPGLARLSRLGLEAVALVAAILHSRALWIYMTAAIVALAASGHAAAIHPTWWGITVDAVHLVAASVWAGGILALVTVRPPGGWRSPAARDLLIRFSPPALTAFTVTVGFGAIQAIQELGTAHALFGSSYGQVLLVKMGLVALMVPLSLVAWRRRRPHFRFEGTLAAFVVAAAAVMAAFPIPPSRLVEEEAARQAAPSISALPTAGADLTLGGHAGQVLVGLTLHPARPGRNDLLLYLLPLEGNQAAGDLKATLTVGRRSLPATPCGDTCRRARVKLQGGETISVTVAGSKGGIATFDIPKLPAPEGSQVLAQMMTRMHALKTYRLDETLSSGLAVVHARYAFEAPDRFESTVTESSGGSQTVWIGGTRYLRQGGGPWQVEKGGPRQRVPSFIWDFFRPFVDARILGQAAVEGVPTRMVAFFGDSGGTPVWFRLWIDQDGLVRQAQMRAQGHFMDHRYYDFDAPIRITPPKV
jgi:putative copper export protein/methionine-rich copper-binding protein CopC